ncbi:MAG: HAMP domain-containing histidine kinase [bacterium]|nr:HAMP domain-containing histidine kinase [bacterium]
MRSQPAQGSDRSVRAAALRLALWNALALLLVLAAADAAFYVIAVGSQRDQLAELAGTPIGDAAIRSFARTLVIAMALANLPILALAAAAAYALSLMAVAPLAASLERQRRFAAQASHELRTPITVIAAEAETALRSGDQVEARAALAAIVEEALRMGRLAGDLLTLARPAGESAVTLEPVDLQEVAAATVRRFAEAARAGGVSLARDGGEQFAPVLGDRERLLALAGNLVANALRATPAGGEICIGVRAEGGQVLLEVRDTGRGIAREHLGEIFEPFVRIDAVDGQGGAGLGLAICRWIAAAHRGTLAAESETGAGATFTLRLPLHTS